MIRELNDAFRRLMHERKPKIVYPFRALTNALRAKDADLYAELSHLPVGMFWRQWKRVHPEDFPQGGASLPHASSVIL